MLYISQPVGTGLSYQDQAVGSFNEYSGDFHYNSSEWPAVGRFPISDPVNVGTIDTTDLAAIGAWVSLKAFKVSGHCSLIVSTTFSMCSRRFSRLCQNWMRSLDLWMLRKTSTYSQNRMAVIMALPSLGTSTNKTRRSRTEACLVIRSTSTLLG